MSKVTPVPKKIYIGAIAVLTVLLITLFTSFHRFNALNNASAWDNHTFKVLLSVNHIMRGLIDIQTGARGFLQTGDTTFLQPYYTGQAEYTKHYELATELTRDNPAQQKRLKLLNEKYRNWLTKDIQPLVALRRRITNTEAALRAAQPGVRIRKAKMDAMRKIGKELEDTETTLLAQRQRAEQQQLGLTKAALLVNGIFAVLLVTGLSLSLVSGMKQLQVANGSLTDQIQQRERAEKETRLLSQHNEMILQAAHDGIMGLNASGKVTFFNPAAEAITGYTATEMIAKSHHDVLHFKYADGSPYPPHECPFLATLSDGKVRRSSSDVFWRKDGNSIPIEFTSAPLGRDGDEESEEIYFSSTKTPKPVGAVVIFRDISERKKNEAATQQLAAMIKYSDLAIMSCTVDGVVTSWNRAATRIYGYGDWEMIGSYVDKLVLPEDADGPSSLLAKIKNGEHIVQQKTIGLRKDGSKVLVALSLSPTKDANGAITGAAGIARELPMDSEQMALEQTEISATETPELASSATEISENAPSDNNAEAVKAPLAESRTNQDGIAPV